MTKRVWTLLTGIGVVIAIGGVVAAAVGFATDTTYPEEVPGWSIMVIVVGILVTVAAMIGRAVTRS